MGKRAKPDRVTQTIDPQSQQYVDHMRQVGQRAERAVMDPSQQFFLRSEDAGSVQDFMNPYVQGVIDPMRAEFDRARQAATTQTGQAATAAGAFGGARHGVAEGTRLAQLDAAQAGQVGQLMHGAYGQALGQREHERQLMERMAQDPLFRHQQALQFMNLGMGPVGSTTDHHQRQNVLGQMFGGGMAAYGAGFGPLGIGVGAALGGIGSLFS